MPKQCFKCGNTRPLSAFYRHKQMLDGHLNKCKDCTKKDAQKYRVENPIKIKEYEKSRARTSKRKKANRQYVERHKEVVYKKRAQWAVENSDKVRKIRKRWIDKNPDYRRFALAKRRATKLSATPTWADLEKIKEIYKNCPEGHQVDHIIPLQSKMVCGLHVENNLQYLTGVENSSKGAKFTPTIEINNGKSNFNRS